MTWRPDTRLVKTFGDYTLTPERNPEGETAHLIDLGDRQIRVLPDGPHSGQMRAKVVRTALEAVAALNGVSGDLVETYLMGAVARAGLSWEWVESDTHEFSGPFADWLRGWFTEPYAIRDYTPAALTDELLRAMHDAGWKVEKS